ncbi:TRAP transporter small permease [Fusobacterium mortiferum]|uniref:TRAP transporter small permease n=1 Tax=Fusobacterium mortiferum TaxID=850 RepID=UPI000E54A1DC|nr:TRAP transporter small permease [Fusobacterium mortiferum]RHF67305.1 TRAP transporter small permease [Fusobacterium mortiferum]
MNNLRNALDKIIIGICVILFMFMTVVGTYQITSRYVLKDPSTISEELISYSFAWMSMFAASYVFGKRDHMRMVFFVERYSEKIQLNIAILSEIVVLLFAFGVLVCGGKAISTLTMTQISPALRVSMGYVYSVLPTCGVITSIYSIINIVDLLKKVKEEA